MRILIVETPHSRHRATEDLLRARGHELHTCEEVEAAWAVYRREQPDLVVLADVGTECLALCRRIRETEPERRIMILALVAPIDHKR